MTYIDFDHGLPGFGLKSRFARRQNVLMHQRIAEINRLDISSEKKARRIKSVMHQTAIDNALVAPFAYPVEKLIDSFIWLWKSAVGQK